MDIKTVYLPVAAIIIVAVSLSIYFLASHVGGLSGGPLNVTFSSNGNDTGSSSVTATLNLVVTFINPTAMDENHISMYMNSIKASAMTGNYTISWASNQGVQSKSSGHPVVWVSSNTGPGYVIFFASSGSTTISKEDILDLMYGNIQISGSTITINPVQISTWSNLTIGMSYPSYSGVESFKL
jgi:hypothetical protein